MDTQTMKTHSNELARQMAALEARYPAPADTAPEAEWKAWEAALDADAELAAVRDEHTRLTVQIERAEAAERDAAIDARHAAQAAAPRQARCLECGTPLTPNDVAASARKGYCYDCAS